MLDIGSNRKKNYNNTPNLPTKASMAVKKHLHWLLILGGVSVLGTVMGVLPHNAEATRAPEINAELPLPEVAAQAPTAIAPATTETVAAIAPEPKPEPPGVWHEATVMQGDSLSRIFSRSGLSAQELHRVTSDKTSADYLKKIFPGETIKLRVDEDQLAELVYDYEINKSLHIVRSETGELRSELIEIPLETRITHATATINDSLFLSAQSVGMSDAVTMELSNIFGWDIDFALDIRQGDSFTAIYEEVYLHGEKVRDGNIVAAEFINQGETYKAIRYTSPDNRTDYYTPEGDSMRKAFLRTPVAFSRISSRFDLRRKHPVLNRIRAHKGVDYAAPTGTPIKATGDGKIVHRGDKGGYGKTIVIQHGNTYSTLYAHMSSYKSGLKVGSRVKQGQTIGFVGSSGLATGPHLHYELQVNGVHRNPLTVKLPNAEPLPKQYMDDFKQHSKQLLAQIDTMKRTSLALADTQ